MTDIDFRPTSSKNITIDFKPKAKGIITDIPFNTELRTAKSPLNLKPMTAEEQAQAQNIGAISRISGMRLSDVARQYEGKTPETGLRRTFDIGMYREPTTKQLVQGITHPFIQSSIIAGMATSPLATLKGLAMGYPVFKASDIAAQKIEEALPQKTPRELKELIGVGGYLGGLSAGGLILNKAQTAIKPLENRINGIIDTAISKAIRPSVMGKKTFGQMQGYYTNAREAVKTVYKNKDNLGLTDEYNQPTKKLPENLNEFSQAIQNTKENIFKQYDTLQQQAGKEGVKINLSPIADEVMRGVNNKALKNLYPEIVDYAQTRVQQLKKAQNFTPEQTQNAIKLLNNSLQSYYKNPTFDTAQKAVIDAAIVNNLRQSLDKSILEMPERLPSESMGNKYSYQQLKNKYSALKTIEQDVNRRAIVDARKNVKGFFDLTDIFSSGQIARGLLSLDPGLIASGIVQKAALNIFQRRNNPNLIIKGMFRNIDKANKQPISLLKGKYKK